MPEPAGATPDTPTSGPLDRPLMLYDGRCRFCCRWTERWRHITGSAVDFQPYQQAAARFPHINYEALGRAVHLVEPSGAVTRGAAAVFRSFQLAGVHRWTAWSYQNIPAFAAISDAAYATVAAHRNAADRIDRLLLGPGTQPKSYRLTQQIFLRFLGVVYLVAFLSLWVQIDGLIGREGILPLHSYLTEVQNLLGPDRYRILPTLCWLNPSDGFLHFLCWGGAAAALLIVVGLVQLPALVLAWAFYLSLTVAGQDFLSFQWDVLLTEAGFLAIFFAPWRIWADRRRAEPSRIILWLLRWLLFRLMFMSGLLKLTSGDATWRAWTAMRYHYETQPLPTWIGWYFFHLPPWFQTLSCGVVFLAELLIPFLIFTPRRVRLVGFWGIIVFQLLIAITGNYGFFNLLAIVLCCVLPDDAFWRWMLRIKSLPSAVPRIAWPRLRAAALGALAVVLLAVTIPKCVDASGMQTPWPRALLQLDDWLAPLRIANDYGLFRVMTTQRPEIIVEGSDDAATWKPYSFKWKPGDLDRPPQFAEPHMPRLDWQMWFAALGAEAREPMLDPWLESFMERLLAGSPPVLRLLAANPFPDHPPQSVRLVLYEYHFATLQSHRADGAWWRRDRIGVFYQLSRRTPADQDHSASP
jgi:predicted DCC family thiol-disulfide oxidoreductase YuxK